MGKPPILFEVTLTITADDARLLRKLLDLGLSHYLTHISDSGPALRLVVSVADKINRQLMDVG